MRRSGRQTAETQARRHERHDEARAGTRLKARRRVEGLLPRAVAGGSNCWSLSEMRRMRSSACDSFLGHRETLHFYCTMRTQPPL